MHRSEPWFRRDRNRWYVTVADGKQVMLRGVPPEDTQVAKELADRIAAEVAARLAPRPVTPADPGTAGEAAEEFLSAKAKKGLSPGTMAGYRWAMDVFGVRWGGVPVGRLDPDAVGADARGRGWSDDTVRNYLVAVEGCLKLAGRAVEFDKPPRGSKGAGAVIPEDVYRLAVGAATGDLGPLLVVLWNTGARPGEVRQLTCEAVDWSSWTATLTRHKNRRRGKASRLLIFPEPAMNVLRRQRERYGTGYLFRTKLGTPYPRPGLTKAVCLLAGKIGRPLTAYGCRHTFATDALAKGVPDTHVAALLGHGSTKMVHQHYSHINENARLLKEAAAKIRGGGA